MTQKEIIHLHNLEYLNNGCSAKVYSIPNKNRVIKFTSDKTEYDFATKIVGKKLNTVVKIFRTFMVDDNNMYGIEAELVCTENKDLHFKVNTILYKNYKESIEYFLYNYTVDHNLKKEIKKEWFDQEVYKYFCQLLSICRTLKKHSVATYDIHKKNIGFRKNKPVLLDLGCMEILS